MDLTLQHTVCDYDPQDITGPIGMFHCPQCGEMVVAGMPHPNYRLLQSSDNEGSYIEVP